jgi:hypothetical protein
MSVDAKLRPMGIAARVLLTALRGYVWFIVSFFSLMVLMYGAAFMPARVGEHRGPSSAPVSLPPNASDVSFYASPPFGPSEACEFTVSEEEFRAWALAKKMPLHPIGEDGLIIPRYLGLASPNDPQSNAHIVDGLSNEWRFEDQCRIWAFDRKTGRGFYYSSSR